MENRIFTCWAGTILAILLLVSTACGKEWWSGQSRSGSYEVEVLVNYRPGPVYHAGGRSYIQGQLGEKYIIRVHNRSHRRVEAVVAVDGKDVIDGGSSSLSRRGYVIPAYSYVDIDGFRISMSQVAAFRFTTVPDSYASRMGSPWEVGIIGVAIFPEKTYYPPPPRRPPFIFGGKKGKSGRGYDSPAAEAYDRSGSYRQSAPSSKNLGTQFGERQASPVSETRFIRQNSSWPAVRLSLRYDNREGLCAIGVGAFCYPSYPPWPPQPPPYYEPPREFANPPPGWEHFSTWY